MNTLRSIKKKRRKKCENEREKLVVDILSIIIVVVAITALWMSEKIVSIDIPSGLAHHKWKRKVRVPKRGEYFSTFVSHLISRDVFHGTQKPTMCFFPFQFIFLSTFSDDTNTIKRLLLIECNATKGFLHNRRE